MQDKHEPRNEFVERLEWQISDEAQRRNRAASIPGWMPQSKMKAVLAFICLMLVSMGIGAAATAAAYQAEDKGRRDLLLLSFESRADLARGNVRATVARLRAEETKLPLGTGSQEAVLEARFRVAEAQARLKGLELKIEEIRITGSEPLSELSSPVVSGRDFVIERLRVEMTVPEAAREFERFRVRETEKRLALGLAGVLDVDASRVQLLEVDAAVEMYRRKLEIRQEFISRKVDAVDTELRVLEVDAEQHKTVLGPKLELARKEGERMAQNATLGRATSYERLELFKRLQDAEAELAKADLELALVRRQLEQRRTGR